MVVGKVTFIPAYCSQEVECSHENLTTSRRSDPRISLFNDHCGSSNHPKPWECHSFGLASNAGQRRHLFGTFSPSFMHKILRQDPAILSFMREKDNNMGLVSFQNIQHLSPWLGSCIRHLKCELIHHQMQS